MSPKKFQILVEEISKDIRKYIDIKEHALNEIEGCENIGIEIEITFVWDNLEETKE